MFEIVKGTQPRRRLHLGVFFVVTPIWVLISVFCRFLSGAPAIFEQRMFLVAGATFFFFLDLATACIYKIFLRGEESFTSEGLSSGAKKLGLWVVIGAGSTVWANTFPNDPQQVSWTDPRWIGANVDLLAFLYMYTVDIVSSVENVTGKEVGETRVGRFLYSISNTYFPKWKKVADEMEHSGETGQSTSSRSNA